MGRVLRVLRFGIWKCKAFGLEFQGSMGFGIRLIGFAWLLCLGGGGVRFFWPAMFSKTVRFLLFRAFSGKQLAWRGPQSGLDNGMPRFGPGGLGFSGCKG